MLNVVETCILARVNVYNITMITSNHVMYNGTVQSILASIVFKDLLCGVQLSGGKPWVLRLTISDPLHQVLHFPTNDTVLPDNLDFIVFFAVNF